MKMMKIGSVVEDRVQELRTRLCDARISPGTNRKDSYAEANTPLVH